MITLHIREEVFVDESRSFGTAVTVVNADERRGRRSEDLTLVLETRVRLNHGDGEIAGSVSL